MIALRGYGSSLIVTKGFGRNYLSPFVKIRDFELSFYKFLKENFTDLHNYPVYYGNIKVNPDIDDIWIYCNFSEFNIENGDFSSIYLEVVTKLTSIGAYNTQLSIITDILRELFVNSNIDLYDFTYEEYPQKILDEKILVMNSGKQVYERLEEIELGGTSVILQIKQMSLKAKLLKDFSSEKVWL